jgi:hypothetical protein
MEHSRIGKVTSIQDNYGGGDHARIGIKHGRRKRSKSGKDDPGVLVDHGQHESHIIIPKEHAKHYTLGQKVNVGIQAAGDDADAGEFDDESNEAAQVASEAKSVPGKQAPIAKGKSKKAVSRIAQAMAKKRK